MANKARYLSYVVRDGAKWPQRYESTEAAKAAITSLGITSLGWLAEDKKGWIVSSNGSWRIGRVWGKMPKTLTTTERQT